MSLSQRRLARQLIKYGSKVKVWSAPSDTSYAAARRANDVQRPKKRKKAMTGVAKKEMS